MVCITLSNIRGPPSLLLISGSPQSISYLSFKTWLLSLHWFLQPLLATLAERCLVSGPKWCFLPLGCCFLLHTIDTLESLCSRGHWMHWNHRKSIPFVFIHVLSWECEFTEGCGKGQVQETNPMLNLESPRHWGKWPQPLLGRVLDSEGLLVSRINRPHLTGLPDTFDSGVVQLGLQLESGLRMHGFDLQILLRTRW